jgi:hypothetical protein
MNDLFSVAYGDGRDAGERALVRRSDQAGRETRQHLRRLLVRFLVQFTPKLQTKSYKFSDYIFGNVLHKEIEIYSNN